MDYKDLDVWKTGIELVLDVYKITKDFSKGRRETPTGNLCSFCISL